MLVIYTPQDGERLEWPFQPYELFNLETEPIEDVGGKSWGSYDEFLAKLRVGNTKAKRALLWILLRRTDPKLRFSDLVMRVDEMTLAPDAEDLAAVRELLKGDSLTPAQRADMEAELEGLEDEPAIVQPEPEGKDEPGGEGTDSP